MTSHPGVFILPDSRKITLRIARELFSLDSVSLNTAANWKLLRDALYSLTISNTDDQEIERALLVAHYMMLKCVTSQMSDQSGAKDLQLKLSVALLRYTDMVRVDQCFYEAGQLCKEAGRLEMAFVFWNHFLDLVEAIEDSDVSDRR